MKIPTLIAEIGINHDGEQSKARDLIRLASEADVDGVKFQYRNPERTHSGTKEIGDELLVSEIRKNYLSPSEINDLALESQRLGLQPGISLFSVEDLADFSGSDLERFSFFKVPSSEMQNYDLVAQFLGKGKLVLISTGMHSISEVKDLASRFHQWPNWLLMHCVSNYPLRLENSAMGNIPILEDILGRDVGYSSHDSDWRAMILAAGAGAKFFERHITHDKNARGLDHSSSSTPDEFSQFSRFAKKTKLALKSRLEPNAGEQINLQNLGRSFYLTRDYSQGQKLDFADLELRSPRVGVWDKTEALSLSGLALVRPVKSSTPLTRNLVLAPDHVTPSRPKSRSKSIGLPVRLHDLGDIQEKFPDIKTFEFHLSHREVLDRLSGFELSGLDPDLRVSVHAPDYCSSTQILDPFSSDAEVLVTSLEIIDNLLDFANELAINTSSTVPIVFSFTSPELSDEDYYSRVEELFGRLQSDNVIPTIQWMPPFAWYFGGSVRIRRNTMMDDARSLRDHKIPVTLDTSHLIMSSNFFGYDTMELIRILEGNIAHVHLGDASGDDGEGLGFSLNSKNLEIIREASAMNCLKIMEVWQGHLHEFQGFSQGLEMLEQVL